MKNTNWHSVFQSGISFEDRIDNLLSPNLYIANSVDDFYKNRRQIAYPFYKKTKKIPELKDTGLVYLSNVTIKVSKPKLPYEFLNEVFIEDGTGSINARWVDSSAYQQAKEKAFSQQLFKEFLKLHDLKNPSLAQNEAFLIMYDALKQDDEYAPFIDKKNPICILARAGNAYSFREVSLLQGILPVQDVQHLFLTYFINHGMASIVDLDVDLDSSNRKQRIFKDSQSKERSRLLDIIGEFSPNY